MSSFDLAQTLAEHEVLRFQAMGFSCAVTVHPSDALPLDFGNDSFVVETASALSSNVALRGVTPRTLVLRRRALCADGHAVLPLSGITRALRIHPYLPAGFNTDNHDR